MHEAHSKQFRDHKFIINFGGWCFIATALLYPILALNFSYPEVFTNSTEDFIGSFVSSSNSERLIWKIITLIPLVLIPAGIGAFEALKKAAPKRAFLAMACIFISTLASMAGLFRWGFIYWDLGIYYEKTKLVQNSEEQAELLAFYNYINQHLGELYGQLVHGFTFASFIAIISMIIFRTNRFPNWLGWFGVTVAIINFAGLAKNYNTVSSYFYDINTNLIITPIWLLLFGIGLVRFKR